jgi:hypothetical protein
LMIFWSLLILGSLRLLPLPRARTPRTV